MSLNKCTEMNSVSYKYRIKTEHCTIVVTYFVERLRKIEIERSEDAYELIAILSSFLDNREATITEFKNMSAKVRELKVNTQQQKIALWCELYKRRYGYSYKVSTAEASAMKNTDVTVELIELFFNLNEWWSKEKTISRYAKNINELKRIFTGKAKPTTSGKSSGTKCQSRQDLAAEFQRRYGNKQ